MIAWSSRAAFRTVCGANASTPSRSSPRCRLLGIRAEVSAEPGRDPTSARFGADATIARPALRATGARAGAIVAPCPSMDGQHQMEIDSRVALLPLLVDVIAAAGVLIVACSSARAASSELCDQFHRECTEARAAGYSDVGICHVEQLECPANANDDASVPKRSRVLRDDDRADPERSYGERAGGP